RGRGPGRRRGRTDSGVLARDREDSLPQGAHRCTARSAREADREPGRDDRGGRETPDPRPRTVGTDPVQIDLRNRCGRHPDFRPRDRLARPDPGRDRRDDRRTGAGMSDLVVLHEVPDSKHGKAPEDRSIEERIRLGIAIVDKPAGPTSHQVSAWVRDMFAVPKAGHSGTLDPRVTGVLPVAFGEADALPLSAFRDAIAYWKEDGDDTSVRAILHPMEDLLRHLPRIVVKDTAVDAICHGANLAVPGVAKLSEHIRVGDLVGVYT